MLKSSKIEPWQSNWILFSAMVETGLHLLGANHNMEKIDKYVYQMFDWYKGDGMYGDGNFFHFDYYNSFVIQPMLLDIVSHFKERYEKIYNKILDHATRYASILERCITPEGYYLFAGRSLCYRTGCFQLLSQACFQHFLEKSLKVSQIRCALTHVIRNCFIKNNAFDKKGWLVPGIYGRQEELAENYINTGSLYLCSTIFLPLGLSERDVFWTMPNADWTSLQIVKGKGKIDKARD